MASIFDLVSFKDIQAEEIQNDDEMIVIPLVGPALGDIEKPSNLVFEKTTGYGKMQFKNIGDKLAIVPSNLMIRGTGAQDHAMSGSGIVVEKTTHVFDNACCIEQSQSGYLKSQNNIEDVLPISLRRSLLSLSLRNHKSYDKLWPDISDWLKGLDIKKTSSAHLNYFYNDKNIKEELEQFAAAFEPVQDQIGAIIFFGKDPVGIEIMSSPEHWNTYWKHLIRGCYGAELLRLKMLNVLQPSTLKLPRVTKDNTLEDITQKIESFSKKLIQEMVDIVKNIQVTNDIRISIDNRKKVEIRLITTKTGGGDIILQESKPVYMSLVL